MKTMIYVYILMLGMISTTDIVGMTKSIVNNNKLYLSDTLPDNILPFSSVKFEPMKLVFDYSHRELPSERIGSNVLSGSWTSSVGRYGWNDYVHTNSFDHLFIALKDEFQVFMNIKPITQKLLSNIDAIVIFAPDNPNNIPDAKVMTEEEIELLRGFVLEGGSLMVMINAVGQGRGSEDFENIQLRKLVNSFGLDWNEVDTHYSDIKLSDNHPYFYDIDNFHYGAGTTIKILKDANNPQILLDVYSNEGYTDRDVQGHGIVMVRHGKGKFILIGDVGSWTGNLSRPWTENELFSKQLFQYLKPSQGVSAPRFSEIDTLTYKIDITGLQAIPVANSLANIETKGYTLYKPRPLTELPYYEVSAKVDLIKKEDLPNNAFEMVANIEELSGLIEDKGYFDTTHRLKMEVSRQGKPANVMPEGFYGKWLSTDIVSTIGLIPTDGIKPGDEWILNENLKIPIFRASDLAPLIELPMEVTYVRNEEVDNKKCRYFRSAGTLWLEEANIKIGDLLPDEEIKRIGGSHYRYFNERGGKLIYNKEQWLDIETGLVIKSRIQTRILAWIEDMNKPIGNNNAEIDNNMIVSLAHVVDVIMVN